MADEVSRDRAWALLNEYTQSPSLLKHALSVETCMAAWGERQALALGLDATAAAALVERYRATALLHDFDYERSSEQEHPFVGVRILEEQGWPEDIRVAILGHALYSGVARETHLARALFACDELSGLLTACALVKPSRSIADVEVAGVRKKMKDKAFARGVSREDIVLGAAELGVELDEQIGFCLRAMQGNAEGLGLAGA
jgi:predicted hydrolase (HD superfamily)